MAAMSPSLSLFHTHFTRQARYHVWATHRLLDAVSRVSDEDYKRDVGLFFKSIHGTLNHLLVGECLLWQQRFPQRKGAVKAGDLRGHQTIVIARRRIGRVEGQGPGQGGLGLGRDLDAHVALVLTPALQAHLNQKGLHVSAIRIKVQNRSL